MAGWARAGWRGARQCSLLPAMVAALLSAVLVAAELGLEAGTGARVRRVVLRSAASSLLVALPVGWLLARREAQVAETRRAAIRRLARGDLAIEAPAGSRQSLDMGLGELHAYLSQLAERANAIAGGRLDLDFAPRGPDDHLGHSLNEMASTLRSLLGEAQHCAAELAGAAGRLLLASRRFAEGAGQQAAAIQGSAASAAELAQTLRTLQERACTVRDVVDLTSTASGDVQARAAEMASVLAQARGETRNLGAALASLASRSREIGEITAGVAEIASNTDLLAINAAIEAARAGEAGRSFAVVAREMRSLASESRQASAGIQAIVEGVLASATAAGNVVDTSQARLEQALNPIGDLVPRMAELGQRVEEARGSLVQVAAITTQQAAAIEQIAAAMRSVDAAAQQDLVESRELAAAAEQLESLGGIMRSLVDTYRVGAR